MNGKMAKLLRLCNKHNSESPSMNKMKREFYALPQTVKAVLRKNVTDFAKFLKEHENAPKDNSEPVLVTEGNNQ